MLLLASLLAHSFTRSLAHSPMQDATSSPWLSNGAEGGEEDAWSDQEYYLSPHDDDADSLSQSLASSSLPEPMDALDGLSFGTSLFSSPYSPPYSPPYSHLNPLSTHSHLTSSHLS